MAFTLLYGIFLFESSVDTRYKFCTEHGWFHFMWFIWLSFLVEAPFFKSPKNFVDFFLLFSFPFYSYYCYYDLNHRIFCKFCVYTTSRKSLKLYDEKWWQFFFVCAVMFRLYVYLRCLFFCDSFSTSTNHCIRSVLQNCSISIHAVVLFSGFFFCCFAHKSIIPK